jgi:hypothetical protein
MSKEIRRLLSNVYETLEDIDKRLEKAEEHLTDIVDKSYIECLKSDVQFTTTDNNIQKLSLEVGRQYYKLGIENIELLKQAVNINPWLKMIEIRVQYSYIIEIWFDDDCIFQFEKLND